MAKKKPVKKAAPGKTGIKRKTPRAKVQPSEPACDFSEAMERVGGDVVLLSQVLAIYLDEIPRMVKCIRNFAKKKLSRELWNEAHKMKGASSHFGGAEVFEILEKIELLAKEEHYKEVPAQLKKLEAALARFKECVGQWHLPSGGSVIV